MKFTLISSLTLAAAVFNCSAVTYWSTHNDGRALAAIDTTTGIATPFANHGLGQTWGAAFDLNGDLLGLYNGFSGSGLGKFNLSTGAFTPIGPTGVPSMIALEISPTGAAYGIGYNDTRLYSIDKSSGAATPIGSGTGVSSVMDLAYSPAGELFATVNNTMYKIDTTTGTASFAYAFSGVAGHIMGITFDGSGKLWGTVYSANGALYEINAANGTAISSVVTGLSLPHGGDTLSAVPEVSSSLILFALAMGGLGLAHRKVS